jgi:sugar phosphate isomerase/epimerase
MQLGIFAKTFSRSTTAGIFDAVSRHRLDCVQFNMSCANLPSMPDQIDPGLCSSIREEMTGKNISMAAVSGTFNMIHPDPEERRKGFNQLKVLAAASNPLGTSVITLCTGTRDPDDKWRSHPDNQTHEAWQDLLGAMQEGLGIADAFNLTLAVEPEVSNVVDSAHKARKLLDELQSPRLKIIMDPANLFHAGELPRMQEILKEAFDLLGDDIIIAHAKDLDRDGEAGDVAAGKGVLDYDTYLSLLHSSGFEGPLIMHGLQEDEVEQSVAFLRWKISMSEATADSGARGQRS